MKFWTSSTGLQGNSSQSLLRGLGGIDFSLDRPQSVNNARNNSVRVGSIRTMEVKSRSDDHSSKSPRAGTTSSKSSSRQTGASCFGPAAMSSEESLDIKHKRLEARHPAPSPQTLQPRDAAPAKEHPAHSRDESLHVTYNLHDVKRLAQEVREGTIAEVHLSLFAFWIRKKPRNHRLAARYIRELSLDQGYPTHRIANIHLRQLMDETTIARPAAPHFSSNVREYPPPESPDGESLYSQESQESKLPQLPGNLTKRKLPAALSLSSLGSIPSSPREYPPNTPDRPAPLSFRSFSSRTNDTVCLGGDVPLRSFSSPLRQSTREEVPEPPNTISALPRNTLIFEENFSHPLLTPTRGPSIPARPPMIGSYALSPSEIASDDESSSVYSCHGESLLEDDDERPLSIHSEPPGGGEWTDLDSYADSDEDEYASQYSRCENSSDTEEPAAYSFTQCSGPAPLAALPPSPPGS